MPARSISRCDTISASFGVSFRMGRKYRDNRMGTLGESAGEREVVSETGSAVKTQGEARVWRLQDRDPASPAPAALSKSRCSNLRSGSPDAWFRAHRQPR